MPEREFKIGPFLGPVTSVDARFLNTSVSVDTRNIRFQDGRLLPRYGYSTLAAAPTGYTSTLGFDFVRGYDSNTSLAEEYISIEDRGGTVYPYSIHPSTGARTVITHSGSSVTLASGIWHSVSYGSQSFCWSEGGSAYVHNLGDTDHFRLVDTVVVVDPVSGTLQVNYSDPETFDPCALTDPDSTYNWDGADSGTISQWEDAIDGDPRTKVFVSENDVTMVWDLDETEQVESVSHAFMEIDLSTTVAGNPDWSSKGVFRLKITHNQGTDSWNFKTTIVGDPILTLVSSGGSSIVMDVCFTQVINRDESENITDTEQYITMTFPTGTDKSVMAAVKYIQMDFYFYSIGLATTRTNITFHEIEVWDNDPANPDPSSSIDEIKFGFTFYKSEWGIESENVKESASVHMDFPSKFFSAAGSGATYYGNTATLIADDPSDTGDGDIDEIKFWFQDVSEGIWRLIATTAYASGGYEVPFTYTELIEGTARNWQAYRPIGVVRWVIDYAGSMVWFKDGGKDNIEFSAVGEPRNLYNLSQTSQERGATMSMSPALDDEPRWAGAADNSLIMLGARGAYASVGLRPIQMTPSKRLPGSKGVIGSRAATRWKGDGGSPGVAWLGTDQELWFAYVSPQFDGSQGFLLIELTQNVRGLVRSFLTQTDAPVVSSLSLAVDERSDSLWLTYQDRAMVLRKPSIIDGQRYWEQYDYTDSWPLLAEDTYYGLRAQTASGRLDELERDSTADFSPITGSNRDAGTVVSVIYWLSKKYSDVRRRIKNLLVEREDSSNTVAVDVITDRQTESVTVAANKKNANVSYKSQGETVQLKISMDEQDSAIDMVTVQEVTGTISRRKD